MQREYNECKQWKCCYFLAWVGIVLWLMDGVLMLLLLPSLLTDIWVQSACSITTWSIINQCKVKGNDTALNQKEKENPSKGKGNPSNENFICSFCSLFFYWGEMGINTISIHSGRVGQKLNILKRKSADFLQKKCCSLATNDCNCLNLMYVNAITFRCVC